MKLNYILFDDPTRNDLLPLTFLKPVAELRIGILTIREKWEKYLGTKTSTLTEHYLCKKYNLIKGKNNILINASILPNEELIQQIIKLKPDQSLIHNDYIIAIHVAEGNLKETSSGNNKEKVSETDKIEEIKCQIPHLKIQYPWDIFSKNGEAIQADFKLLTKGRKSAEISKTNRVIGEENIFIEEGAIVEHTIINASEGPVYIGENAEIMEGCLIRGPFALCEKALLKMGAKIYGPTTIGPGCKVGGEVNNSVFTANSNKAHEGFIGNSVIGEWCNIGADSNNSNLKNTYEEVKMWNYTQEKFIPTGLQFCGLIMGDHSKCGINTMFNTGTIVGISANIFGHGYQRNYIPSFSWGSSASSYSTYDINKAIKVAENVYKRRGLSFDEKETEIFRFLFNQVK